MMSEHTISAATGIGVSAKVDIVERLKRVAAVQGEPFGMTDTLEWLAAMEIERLRAALASLNASSSNPSPPKGM